ncbi:MAG: PQQ-binding-like beta-propeller repeat protein [candidate division Zixibacteria bacterium]|nr:PQQ-binding-like beta-propeller repeat protein [candidate division Zixibacteria bacterium]
MKKHKHILIYVSLTLLLAGGCSSKYRLDRDEISRPAAWPYHHGDLASTGAVPDGRFSGKLDILWEFKSNDKPAGPLVIYNDRIVYPGTRHKIKFVDLMTGSKAGQFKSKGEAQTGLVMLDSLGYFAVGPRRSRLKCANFVTGKIMWQRPVKDAAEGSILVDNRLYVSSTEGVLMALDPYSGDLLWRFSASGLLKAPASFGAEKIFQPFDDGLLYALTPEGKELFHVELDAPLVSPVSIADLVYCADVAGNLYGIDPEDGRIRWRDHIDGPVWASVTVADGRLFVGHTGGELVALEAATGKTLWRYDADEAIVASAVVAGQYVVFGTMGGKVFSLRTADGTLVQERQLSGAVATTPITDGDRVFVATDKGIVTCFGETDDQLMQTTQRINPERQSE